MSNPVSDLDAEFNRWNISKKDFEEAHNYLRLFVSTMDMTIRRGLLSAAIVAYARPFKSSRGKPNAIPYIQLPERFFDAEEMELHQKIIFLRDKGIAHSDFEMKATSRVPSPGAGVLTWSKPFNPLYEGIDTERFERMALHLHCHCIDECRRLNHLLNGVEWGTRPQPEGAEISLTIPLPEFTPKNN